MATWRSSECSARPRECVLLLLLLLLLALHAPVGCCAVAAAAAAAAAGNASSAPASASARTLVLRPPSAAPSAGAAASAGGADNDRPPPPADDVDISVIIALHGPLGPHGESGGVYLRHSLQSLLAGAQAEGVVLQVIIVEASAGDLTPRQRFERRDAVLDALARFAAGSSSRAVADVAFLVSEGGSARHLADVYNRAVTREAVAPAALLLDEKCEVLPGTLRALKRWARSFPGTGAAAAAVGGLVLRPDGSVYHAGTGFGMGRFPSAPAVYWWEERDGDEEVNIPLAENVFQGVSPRNVHVRDFDETGRECVSGVGVLLNRRVFTGAVAGFRANYSSPEFTLLDLCMRARRRLNLTVMYDPAVRFVFSGAAERFDNRDDVVAFDTEWGDEIEEELRALRAVHNFTLVWNMECGVDAVLGFTMEALAIVDALAERLPLKVDMYDWPSCRRDLETIGIAPYLLDKMQRLEGVRVEGEVVVVLHRDPGRYSSALSTSYDGRFPSFVIGRSMFETDRIPSEWVPKCNDDLVDEIWVPSEFNVETFSRSGVAAEKLHVVHELVDVHTFDPTAVVRPLRLPGRGGFAFLTVMKWERRKGWDVLLRAYFGAFSATEDVTLYVRSRLDDAAQDEYNGFVELFLNEARRSADSLPAVVFLPDSIPVYSLPALYAAVDCFVLPSHGEGWGLPMMEAMSMGLPTIATNWSGNTVFMSQSNSYLVPVEGLENATVPGHLWARPSMEALVQLLRRVFEHREEARRIGRAARRDVEARFGLESSAGAILARFSALEKTLDVLVSQKEARRSEVQARLERFREANRDKVAIKIVD